MTVVEYWRLQWASGAAQSALFIVAMPFVMVALLVLFKELRTHLGMVGYPAMGQAPHR